MQSWVVYSHLLLHTQIILHIYHFVHVQVCPKDIKAQKWDSSPVRVRLIFSPTSSVWDFPFTSVLPIESMWSDFWCSVYITLMYYLSSLETSGFVDKLFESLYTKNYLPPLEPVKPEPKPPVQEKEEIKEEVMQNFLLLLGNLRFYTSVFISWKLTSLEVIETCGMCAWYRVFFRAS